MTTTLTPLPVHEIANMMPEMTDDERQALLENIKANGQLVPIITLDGAIIDGRHRYWACMELGIEPRTQEWQGSRDTDVIIQSMIAMNVMRRHLTVSQRAMLGLNFLPYFEERARERKESTQFGSIADQIKLSEPVGQARDQVAALVKVAPSYVSAAKKLRNWNPEVADAVARGDISLMDAGRMMKEDVAPVEGNPAPDVTPPDTPDTHSPAGPETATAAPESILEPQPIRIPNPAHNWRENVTYAVRYEGGEWDVSEL